MVLFGFAISGDQRNFNTKCTKSKMSESDFKRNGILGITAHDLSNKFHKNFNQYEELLQQKLTVGPTSSSNNGNNISGKDGGVENVSEQASNKFHSTTSGRIAGGRLQFFKDGKFILELASSREGERLGWVSVPRKTYWPPTISSNNSVSFQKHESSTSLSYSDDNSSIQSSPWQRDHCWKQSSPRRNISKEMSLYYRRPAILKPIVESLKYSKKKRRRPYDKRFLVHRVEPVLLETPNCTANKNEVTDRSKNTQNENENTQQTEEKTPTTKTINTFINEIESPHQLANGSSKSKLSAKRTPLETIVKKLSERNPQSLSSQNVRMNQLTISNHHHHVSPRKRILRELEKVSLEDVTMKRSRAKTSIPISGSISATTHSPTHIKSPSGRHLNGNSVTSGEIIPLSPCIQQTSHPRAISSYSITSLLSHNISDSSNNKSGSPNSSTIIRKDQLESLSASASQQKDYEYNRNLKSSPEPISQKLYSTSMTSSGGRKLASPIYHPRTPPPNNNDQSKQPSNLGSSPEQQQQNLNKYRQHPYIYNPQVTIMGSPSISSPSLIAENFNQKYRASYLSSNSPGVSYNSLPQHQLLKRESPVATTSTLSGRKSPLQSYTHATNFHSHFGHYQSIKERDLSPSRSPKKQDYPGKYEKYTTSTSTSSSSSQQSGLGRTVPKKNTSLRQQYESPTRSPSEHINTFSLQEDNHYKPPNKLKNYNKGNSETSVASTKIQHRHYKLTEYDNEERNDLVVDHYHSPNSIASMSVDSSSANSIIRPSPSQQTHMATIASPHPASHPNLFYGMYSPHTLHHSQSSLQAQIQAAAQQSFLSPATVPSYYHLYAAAAASAAFRPLWPQYPSVVPAMGQHHLSSPAVNSRISSSLLNFSGASSGLIAHPAEPSWEQIAARHTLASNEALRVKDDLSSDVPLNLSKH